MCLPFSISPPPASTLIVYSASIRSSLFLISHSTPLYGSALFAGRERENQVAVGNALLVFQTQQRRDERRRAALHVLRAAAVEVSVVLGQHERIVRPVFALRLDDVEMREQQASACARPLPR